MRTHISGWLVSALLSCSALAIPLEATQGVEIEERQLNPFQTYKSSLATNPQAMITTSTSTDPLAAGSLIFSPEYSGASPMIMDIATGNLIWGAPPNTYNGFNLRVQELNGQQVMTLFKAEFSYLSKGILYGSTQIIDSSYRLIATVCPDLNLNIPFSSDPVKCQGDLHEQEITADNTLLITAYDVKSYDLSPINGPSNGYVVEAQIYELDIDSGDILFSWKSLDHVPITKTKAPFGAAGSGNSGTDSFNYFHVNSAQKVGNNYLVNGRHTWASYLIDGTDGSIIWEFNGYNGGDFGPLPSAPSDVGDSQHVFAWQHDAKIQSMNGGNVVLTMFNNDNTNPYSAPNPSNGLTFQLNTNTFTSQLLNAYRDTSAEVGSGMEGGMQQLPNGNALVSYGNMPVVQEFGSDDTDPLVTLKFGTGPRGGSYRVYKSQWVGKPLSRPSVVLDKDNGVGYVSWNGATEVARWVLKSGTPKKTKKTVNVPKTGFETQFALPKATKKGGKYLQVVAYDSNNNAIGASKILKFTS